MRLAERFGRHAGETALLAVIAGETPSPHVSSCAACQARLEELRAWIAVTAADAGSMADGIFTPERLAAQKQQVLARLEAAGRSARVIAFPLGASAPALRNKRELIQWIAAAAVGGIMVGIVSGRLMDRQIAPAARNAATGAQPVVVPATNAGSLQDEAALLEAAYDRISLDSLQAIDDMTPRVREVARSSGPSAPRARR